MRGLVVQQVARYDARCGMTTKYGEISPRFVVFNENNQLKWWLPMRQGLRRKSAVGFEIVFC